MSNKRELPLDWSSDSTLQIDIPHPHNYRTFKRLPENPRYAVCIAGGGIYDTKRRRFLQSQKGPNGRIRYALTLKDAGNPFIKAPIRKLYYARLICIAAFGPPPDSRFEAHHLDSNRTNDNWQNLRWATGRSNRKMAAQARKHPRQKFDRKLLEDFIRMHDAFADDGPVDFDKIKIYFPKVSKRQLYNWANGTSRKREVTEIRAKIQTNNPAKTEVTNPFLDLYD